MACTSDSSDRILRSRVEDTLRLCDKRGAPCFLGFLDLREQAIAQQLLRSFSKEVDIRFYGGYPEAERTILSITPLYLPVDEEGYPLISIAFQYRAQKNITHRDVLGTLMSAGVRRDAIGDILCGDGLSVVFVKEEVSSYICDQIDCIGGEGVVVIPHYDGELPLSVNYEPIRETVASPRLDSIVKALVHCSREQSAEMIRLGNVSVNHLPSESVTKPVAEGDIISIRGYGRFYIDQVGPETKKGRLMLLARRRL